MGEKENSNFENNDNQIFHNIPFVKNYNIGDKIHIFNSDFETTGNKLLKNIEGLTIFTNLPYGRRSDNNMKKDELKLTYQRFAKFIYKNMEKLEGVFIICNENSEKNNENFIKTSRLWLNN